MVGQNNNTRNTTTIKPETTEPRNKIQKMEIHRPYPRKDHNNDCNIALKAEEREEDPEPPWRRTVEKEREESGWRSWADARVAAADRDGWRRYVDALCATRHKADRSRSRATNVLEQPEILKLV